MAASLTSCVLAVKPFSGYYISCPSCKKKLRELKNRPTSESKSYWCLRCDQSYSQVSLTYVMALTIANGDSCIDTISFGEPLNQLLGATADQVHQFITCCSSSVSVFRKALSIIFLGRHFKFEFLKPLATKTSSSSFAIVRIKPLSNHTPSMNIITIMERLLDPSGPGIIETVKQDPDLPLTICSLYSDTSLDRVGSPITLETLSTTPSKTCSDDVIITSPVDDQFWKDFYSFSGSSSPVESLPERGSSLSERGNSLSDHSTAEQEEEWEEFIPPSLPCSVDDNFLGTQFWRDIPLTQIVGMATANQDESSHDQGTLVDVQVNHTSVSTNRDSFSSSIDLFAHTPDLFKSSRSDVTGTVETLRDSSPSLLKTSTPAGLSRHLNARKLLMRQCHSYLNDSFENTSMITGNTGTDTGNTGTDTGSTGTDTGNTGTDTGSTGTDTGNAGSNIGVTSGITGTDTGNAGSNIGVTSGITGTSTGSTGTDTGNTGLTGTGRTATELTPHCYKLQKFLPQDSPDLF